MEKCKGLTSAGQPCQLRPEAGSEYCRFHQDQGAQPQPAESGSGVIHVSVGKVPGRVESLVLPEGSTVADAFARFSELTGVETRPAPGPIGGLPLGEVYDEVRINNLVVYADETLKEGDICLIVNKIRGG